MKVRVYTTDGAKLEIHGFGQDGVLPLIDAFKDPDVYVLAFEMDGEPVYVNKRNVCRIEVA